MGVAIQASFGKDQKALNGLEAIIDELLTKPREEHYVICKVRSARTSVDHENGDVSTPTVKFIHIEPMLDDKSGQAARKLFEQAALARLGELPQQTLFEDHNTDEDEDDRPWPGDKASVGPDFIAPVATGARDDTDTAPTAKAPRKRPPKLVDAE